MNLNAYLKQRLLAKTRNKDVDEAGEFLPNVQFKKVPPKPLVKFETSSAKTWKETDRATRQWQKKKRNKNRVPKGGIRSLFIQNIEEEILPEEDF